MSHPKPTVDLGYPTESHGRIPSFNNMKEEAAFWDTHDVTDYLDKSSPVDLSAGPELAGKLTLRLARQDREALRLLAQRNGVDPSTLARMWLEERLHAEAEAGSR